VASDEELDRLIEVWAARRAPALIARAEAEALDAAARRLKDRMAAALERSALTQLAGAPPPAPVADSSEPLLWLYGVVGAHVREPPAADGVDGRPVFLHRRGSLAALLSEVPRDQFDEDALRTRLEDLAAVEVLARGHDAVLEAAMANDTVVPFRLCTIYSSIGGLNAMLDRETAMLTSTLARLDGMQELGVKAFLLASPGASAREQLPTPESGTAYLTLKREERQTAEHDREADDTAVAEIHARLAERAAAAKLSMPQDRRLSGRDAEMTLNAAYLVPVDEADAFRELVERLARDHEARLELEVTGPWPPYNFVDLPQP
jgi:hypothetical protein